LNKYHAKRTEVDGIMFHSKKEASRYLDLAILQRIGEIKDLRLQPAYPLDVNGVRIAMYHADFDYWDVKKCVRVVEDVKSAITKKKRDYRIIKKLILALYCVEILET
jgi:hypothetical protein